MVWDTTERTTLERQRGSLPATCEGNAAASLVAFYYSPMPCVYSYKPQYAFRFLWRCPCSASICTASLPAVAFHQEERIHELTRAHERKGLDRRCIWTETDFRCISSSQGPSRVLILGRHPPHYRCSRTLIARCVKNRCSATGCVPCGRTRWCACIMVTN